MYRKLLATTAAATLMAGAVHASESAMNAPHGKLASEIIGAGVYSALVQDDGRIGRVSDIVLSADGTARLAVIGVGGFLGVGEKDVAVAFEDLQWVTNEDGRWLFVSMTQEELEADPGFDRTAWTFQEQNGGGMSGTASYMAPAPVGGVSHEATGSVSTDDFIGAEVHGADGESIGYVSEMLMDHEGQVDAVIVDVGGFLGIGAKPVAVSMSELAVTFDDGGVTVLHGSMTAEQLEAAPEYDETLGAAPLVTVD